ncbi:hypothetical protein DFJ58DRAFT_188414 [Suillus subalutaceus]|uniref:uncharacterized protein n=1 Tax=Suillus subalutaceus TaxID=48586 RepID=UPI001B85C8FF|nr:uncharacterized protein DFJ58DRAFT_188414 [Suillus subalutaceus]KAG1836249.1 hypothetical protein DFJ58DRAFT_188414 [Suillus subalutaceus]
MGRFCAFVLVLVIHSSAAECPPVGCTTILGRRSTFIGGQVRDGVITRPFFGHRFPSSQTIVNDQKICRYQFLFFVHPTL